MTCKICFEIYPAKQKPLIALIIFLTNQRCNVRFKDKYIQFRLECTIFITSRKCRIFHFLLQKLFEILFFVSYIFFCFVLQSIRLPLIHQICFVEESNLRFFLHLPIFKQCGIFFFRCTCFIDFSFASFLWLHLLFILSFFVLFLSVIFKYSFTRQRIY